MNTILITGAGLIGCHLARVALDCGNRVILFDLEPNKEYIAHILGSRDIHIVQGDVRDLPLLILVVSEEAVNQIAHTAGLIGAKVYTRPYIGFQANVQGTVNIAETARLSEAERVVFCSSMAVYALSEGAEGPIEEHFPVGPDNIYGATKLAAEQLLETYGKKFGFQVVSLRLAGVYGYGPYLGGSWMGRVLYGLLSGSLMGHPVELDPAHLGINEYVYVEDVAKALYQALVVRELPHNIFNVGTGILTSYKEVVEIIESLIPQARILVKGSYEETIGYLKRSQPFSIERAKQELDFVPQYDMRRGLSDFVNRLRELHGTNTV